ncbi:MAG: hypothetical protein AB1515_04445 [Nitrospirota bacterium]
MRMTDMNSSPKNLLIYIGIALLLTGAAAATGEDMVLLLLGGITILALEVMALPTLSRKQNVLAQLTLSGALLIVSIIKLVESIGKNFAPQHLYLTMMLIGLILILIDVFKQYSAIPRS